MSSSSSASAPSGLLIDTDQVACGVAKRAVANPVGLISWLLDDLGALGLQLREGTVDVGGGQDDDAVRALRHHLGDHAALVVGDTGACGGGGGGDRCDGVVGWGEPATR